MGHLLNRPRPLLLLLACAIGPLTLSACSGACSTPSPPSDRPLLQEEAARRARQVSAVAYNLRFDLPEKENEYSGSARIQFEVSRRTLGEGEKLFVDFLAGTIGRMRLNGTERPSRYDGERITLPVQELREGANLLEIDFKHPYATNGRGLNRFVDPADGRTYIYTDLEPYHARAVFPCFDQPDIKASYTLTVTAPDDWIMVANTREKRIISTPDRMRTKTWEFPTSQRFSTYIFALHGGPYTIWQSSVRTRGAGRIPLRLFARRSLAKYVDHREWLDVTAEGFKFFERAFGYPYPFKKYDQVVVPDFNTGAMENVAAVTFSEEYIHRTTRVTGKMRMDRAEVILHEMAHMWFGNLVTMVWWDDLWLNESFASYSAYWALSRLPTRLTSRWGDPWLAFQSDMKQWAYWEDQLVTNHPIAGPVPDTRHAETIFDGITYGKGAAALKQLVYFLGEKKFQDGLARYFKKHEYRNASLRDFLASLSDSARVDLSKWETLWLRTAGLNRLETDWKCTRAGKIERLHLIQSGTPLRPHRTEIALIYREGEKLKPSPKSLSVAYSGRTTPVAEAVGLRCPALVYPNANDYDYIKAILDPATQKIALQNLLRVEDPLLRALLWRSLWELTVDGDLKSQAFAEAALSQLGSEDAEIVAGQVLDELYNASATHFTAIKYIPDPHRRAYRTRLEKLARQELDSAPRGSDLQVLWFETFLGLAASPESLRLLSSWLDGGKKIPGLPFDPERRWQIVTALASAGDPSAPRRIEAELTHDRTDRGQKHAILAEAARPNLESKRKMWERIIRGEERLALLKSAMRGFHRSGQESLSREFVKPFFAVLPSLVRERDEEFSDAFVRRMLPPLCEPAIIEEIDRVLAPTPGDPSSNPSIVKSLQVHRQETERCLRARRENHPISSASTPRDSDPSP